MPDPLLTKHTKLNYTCQPKQGSATCYQILCHPNTYEYPRDQWVDKSQVSGPNMSGVGLSNADSPVQKPNALAEAARPVAKRIAAMDAISMKKR